MWRQLQETRPDKVVIDMTNEEELPQRQLELMHWWKRRRARPNDSCKADFHTFRELIGKVLQGGAERGEEGKKQAIW